MLIYIILSWMLAHVAYYINFNGGFRDQIKTW